MANYSLVINSKFRPFEYQELLAPVLMATQAHQAVEEAYADLSTKASIWDKMTNEVTDQKAHDMYKKYADDLEVPVLFRMCHKYPLFSEGYAQYESKV